MPSRQRAIINFLDEVSACRMHGFRLSLKGDVLAEGYWAPFTPQEPHRLYSVSKSVTSLAIGILAGQGRIRLDDPICVYFPDLVDADTPVMLREVTIRHMLRMSTCFDRAMYSIDMDDWTRPFFRGVPTHPAGTLFHYDTSASQVMCALVEKLSGQDILSFMEENLFRPIGMYGPKKWLKDKAGTSQGGTGLLMTLKDFSLLADFCMSDGRGLIPADYLKSATSLQIMTQERTAPEEKHGYGYQFWMMRKGFAMYGMGGQMAMCLPEQQLSLCTTADTILSSVGVQPLYDAFFRHLDGIEALEDNPADKAELAARLCDLRCPALTPAFSCKDTLRIDLVDSALPFTALTIRPDEVLFHLPGGDFSLPYGQGAWADGIFPTTTERCITSGGWMTPSRFCLHCEVKDNFINALEMAVGFDGNRASVRLSSSLWELVSGWSGLSWGYACS
ncbi:MAG: serine hydrolase [Clostridia bacterium]|nr:serine hydrolase [Clostridia bacterium]